MCIQARILSELIDHDPHVVPDMEMLLVRNLVVGLQELCRRMKGEI
jgi:hypothetical protein